MLFNELEKTTNCKAQKDFIEVIKNSPHIIKLLGNMGSLKVMLWESYVLERYDLYIKFIADIR